uniref:L,D-transpeptidase family protein n=1 Tax=Thaumasiovibrio occultus TaxID=1891184 RepID=UPI00192CEFBB|nr:L,D-transpeptidase family protein [Thaumasiovibrio occultus]
MYLMSQQAIVREYRIALGANPQGHKTQQGDERTPEGRYTLDYVKEDSTFYRAMHISYPNRQDRATARENDVDPGGFIMVHGQPNGYGFISVLSQRLDWTDGCIALTNAEMNEFLRLVPVGTPIHIEW